MADISSFRAGLGEATAIAKAETTASATAINGLATIGKAAFLGLGVAAVVGGVAATKMAGDFEAATNRLVTSAGEQRSSIEAVRSGLLQMAGEVGYSAMDLTAAYYQASSAGYTFAHGGLDVVRAAAQGAKTEGADLKVVTDAVTSAMIDYHRPASAAAQVTTTLVAAVSQGKTTFAELTGSLHSVLPVASAAHISLADITAAVASMTVHGMSANQATDNLAHTIEHLQKVTTPQAKELAVLGISAQHLSADLGSKGLTGTLQMISAAIQSHMGPDGMVVLNLQQALAKLPPAVQQLGAAAAAGTISMGDYAKATKGMSVEAAGQAAGFATLLKATHGIGQDQKTGAQITQAYAAALAAATGDATTMNTALMLTGENAGYTANAVRAVAGATTEAGNNVAGWASIQATFNQRVDRARETIGALLIVIGAGLIPIVGGAIDATMRLAEWMGHNLQVTIPLAAAIGGVLLVAIGAYIAAMATAAVATIAATWPLLLVVAAIALAAAGVAILVMHWQQIVNAIGPLKAGLTTLSNTWKVFTGDLRDHRDVFTATEDGLMQLGVSADKALPAGAHMRDIWSGLAPVFKVIHDVVRSVSDDIRAGVGPWLMLENALQAAGVSGSQAMAIGARLREVWSGVHAALNQLGRMILAIVLPALAQMGKDAGPLMAQVGAAFQSLAPILQIVGPALRLLGQIIGVIVVVAIGLLLGVLKGLLQALAVILPAAVHVAITVIDLLVSVVKLIADVVVGVVKIVADIFRGDWAGAWNDAKALVANVAGDIGHIVGDLFDLIGTIVHASLAATLAFIGGFVSGAVGFFTWLLHELVGGSIVPDMITGIVQWFQKLPGEILGILSGLVGSAAAAASQIGTAILNGITGALGGLAGALENAAAGALNAAKAKLGISSPSAVFAAEVGLPIAQGVALGISQGAPTAIGAMGTLVRGMTGGATAGLGGTYSVGGQSSSTSASSSTAYQGSQQGGYSIVFNLYGCSDPTGTAVAIDARLGHLLASS